MQKVTELKESVSAFYEVKDMYGDLCALVELVEEEDSSELFEEAETELAKLQQKLNKTELMALLGNPYDYNNAIMHLHPGAGGTEAQEWVEMLLRMYTRWAEEQGYKVNIIDILQGDDVGVKSVTMSIEGPYAFGYLKTEKGVHRLVRISPFDTAGRRHTTFASVEVMPDVDDDVEIEINQEDLKIDTYRAGGAGGQHVNKTDSAVRVTHIPTGIVIQCQSERSQASNKSAAMKLLRARLVDLELQKKEEKLAEIRGEQRDIAWGSQIRSYVFHPYQMVKDHRTNVEVGNVESVMDGNLDKFILTYLQQKARG